MLEQTLYHIINQIQCLDIHNLLIRNHNGFLNTLVLECSLHLSLMTTSKYGLFVKCMFPLSNGANV